MAWPNSLAMFLLMLESSVQPLGGAHSYFQTTACMARHGVKIGAAVQCDARHRGEILLGHWWSRRAQYEFAEAVLGEIRCFLDPYSMSSQD